MARHRWERQSQDRRTCSRCGMLAERRLHPYGLRQWTEWSRNGQYWSTLNGDKTPPCGPDDESATN